MILSFVDKPGQLAAEGLEDLLFAEGELDVFVESFSQKLDQKLVLDAQGADLDQHRAGILLGMDVLREELDELDGVLAGSDLVHVGVAV